MRIFEVLNASSTGGIISNQIWLRNLYEPLLDLGHEVFLFRAEDGFKAKRGADRKLKSLFSEKLLSSFLNENRKRPFDLFFAYLMDGTVNVEVIDDIRKIGVPTCNFSCNNTHQFGLVDEISPHFDFNLHSEKDASEKFRSIGANPVWFPMAANPNYYHPYNVPRDIDVSFIGQNYAKRPFYIWHLLENGIKVHVYGPGWRLRGQGGIYREFLRQGRRLQTALRTLLAVQSKKRTLWASKLAWLDFCEQLRLKYDSYVHPPLSDAEMIHKYSESKISLGFLEVHDEHNPTALLKQHLHLRDFEAPMCGALYMTGYCKELEEFFEPDKEVVVYRNEHELLDKIRYYLSHSQDSERIRNKGHDRAMNCHSYQRRFQNLFSSLGI